MSAQLPQESASASDFGSKHFDFAERGSNQEQKSQDPFADKEHRVPEQETIPPSKELPSDVESAQQQIQAVDVPPNGGYGWVIVLCNALINAHTWGLNSVSTP